MVQVTAGTATVPRLAANADMRDVAAAAARADVRQAKERVCLEKSFKQTRLLLQQDIYIVCYNTWTAFFVQTGKGHLWKAII
ncbi:hypothetical protein GCM10008919_02620 [Selenomonas dianae]|uniref:Uncharacterized protein n=1 Tax=Selenomonas dianae TaxID=135079 RepID=A0ABP3CGH1_9FIRM